MSEIIPQENQQLLIDHPGFTAITKHINVDKMPEKAEGSAMYIVKTPNPTEPDIYITNEDGTDVRKVLKQDHVYQVWENPNQTLSSDLTGQTPTITETACADKENCCGNPDCEGTGQWVPFPTKPETTETPKQHRPTGKKLIPIYNPANNSGFVSLDLLRPTLVEDVRGLPFVTQALAIGKKLSLLGISATVPDGDVREDKPWSLDPAIYLKKVWLKFPEKVVEINVNGLVGTMFQLNGQGDYRNMSLDFKSNILINTYNSEQVGGEDLSLLPGLNDGALLIMFGLKMMGTVGIETSDVEVHAEPVVAKGVLDPKTGAIFGAEYAANSPVVEVIGYELDFWLLPDLPSAGSENSSNKPPEPQATKQNFIPAMLEPHQLHLLYAMETQRFLRCSGRVVALTDEMRQRIERNKQLWLEEMCVKPEDVPEDLDKHYHLPEGWSYPAP